jgi:hypothetical protein
MKYCLFSLLFILSFNQNSYAEIFPFDCITDYDIYLNKEYNITEPHIHNYIIHNYSDVTANQCINYCNEIDNCSSFNYDDSKCLIMNATFNESYLSNKPYSVYCYKTSHFCENKSRYNYDIIFLVFVILIFIIFITYFILKYRTRTNQILNNTSYNRVQVDDRTWLLTDDNQ